jgi:hypothetical protein
MANRNFDTVQALGKEIKIIAGSFAPNGTSDVDASLSTGLGYSVARLNVGQFQITLEDYYVALQSATVSLELNTPSDKILLLGESSITTSDKFVKVNVWDISDAALADIAPNAHNRIHFNLVLRNSTVGK